MSGDYNINVNLNADVSGSDDVKALAKEIRDLLVGAEKGSKGIGNEAKKTSAALKQTKNDAQGLSSSIGQGLQGLQQLGKAAVAAWASMKLGQYIMEVTTLAARYETLGAVMNNVGANAGYSSGQMAVFEEQLKKTGISSIKARDALTMMAGAQMDLTKSSELARVAQDAAVIGGINSSEAFQRMVQGIRSGQTETLRTIGINVNFQRSYDALAKTLGKSSDALTNQEKTIARQNAVMEEGAKLAGAYESSMETAGKQALSSERYIEDFKVKAGEAFMPAYTEAITMMTKGLKDMNEWLKDNAIGLADFAQAVKQLVQAGGSLVDTLKLITGGGESASGVLSALAIVIRGVGFTIALVSSLLQTLAADIAIIIGWIGGADNAMYKWGQTTLSTENALDKFLDTVEAGEAKVRKTAVQVEQLAAAEAAAAEYAEKYYDYQSKIAAAEARGVDVSKDKALLERLKLEKDILEFKRDSYRAGKFEEEMDGPQEPVKGSGDDEAAAAEKAKAAREKNAKQELDLVKAKHALLVSIAKNGLVAKQRDLDASFKNQELSIEAYYTKRKNQMLESLAAEKAAKVAEIEAEKKIPVKAGEEKARQAQNIRAQTELNEIKARELVIIDENKEKSKEATREFLADLQEIRTQLESLQGNRSTDSIDREIEAKFKNLRAQAEANIKVAPDGVGLVDKLIDVEKARANFAALQKVYNDTLEKMTIKEREIQNNEQLGITGPAQTYEELNKVHLETSAVLDELLPKMAAYAKAIGDESAKNALANMKLSVGGIKDTVTELGAAIDSGVTNDVKSLFDDITDSSKSAEDSIKDFGRSVLRTFMDIINKQLATQLMTSLFGGGSGGGSSAGFWSSLMGGAMKKKDGGPIYGPGTSTSDSIPALLSDGEYVIRASAAKRIGMGYLDYLNGIASRPKFSKFSDGGPALSSVSPTTSQEAGGKGDVNVVNLFDPSMLDEFLKTRKGEKAILNVIEANPRFVKALIR